jgi:hypothetical protein
MNVSDQISTLRLPPGERSSSLLFLCITLRHLAKGAPNVQLADGRMIHDGLDCGDYLNEVADALYQVARQEKIFNLASRCKSSVLPNSEDCPSRP